MQLFYVHCLLWAILNRQSRLIFPRRMTLPTLTYVVFRETPCNLRSMYHYYKVKYDQESASPNYSSPIVLCMFYHESRSFKGDVGCIRIYSYVRVIFSWRLINNSIKCNFLHAHFQVLNQSYRPRKN